MKKFITLTLFSLFSITTLAQNSTHFIQSTHTFLGSTNIEKMNVSDNTSNKIAMMIEFINRKNNQSLAKFTNLTPIGTPAHGEAHVNGYVKNQKGQDTKSLLHYVFIPKLKDDGKITLDYLVATVPDEKIDGAEVNDILVQGTMTVESHKTYSINLNDYVAIRFSLQKQ